MQQIKFNTQADNTIKPSGPMCSLDMKPRNTGSTLANTGAVSSAFIGFLI